MKKVGFAGLFITSFFIFTACTNNAKTETSVSTSNEKKTIVSAEKTDSVKNSADYTGYSFKDGLLSTPDYDIKIDKTELGHATGEDGLIMWFTIKNKSEHNIIPQDALYSLQIKQQDDTSEYEIPTDYNYLSVAEMLYPTYNDDASTVEDSLYEENGKKQAQFEDEFGKKFYAELLPEKEVKTAIGFTLQNTEHPISINIAEPFASEIKSKEYTIKLK